MSLDVGRGIKRILLLLEGALGLDLLTILVTGDTSLWGSLVTPAGFLARLLILSALGLLSYRLWLVGATGDGHVLALSVFAVLALYPFQYAGGRINGDGPFYYAYLRSFWKDGDVHFENEYRYFGLADRRDLAQPTDTGYRRTVFSAGPAVLWSPFFGIGEAYARLLHLLRGESDLSGYGPTHRNAVALGSFVYGFAAVLLTHAFLRRYFARTTAFVASLLVWLASNLFWYMVQQPTMSHAGSAFAAALFLWLWDRTSWTSRWRDALALGLTGGLAACIRWQNALLFLLLVLLVRGFSRSAGGVRAVAALGAGAFVGVLPQLLAWKSIFGVYLLSDPPPGADFLRLDRPFVLETLFSSRHGLLSWTPVLWLGYAGILVQLKRRFTLVAPLALVLFTMTYVNMCSGDWWAGGSFSNRRFDSVLPILAFGIAASIDVIRAFIARRPGVVVGGLVSGAVLWNFLLMEQYRYMIPRDDTVSFTTLVSNNAKVAFEKAGAPFAWPANWLFAWRYGVSPDRYDLLVGRYLFFRQNNLGGVVELGEDDGGLLGDGWRRPEERDGARVRQIRGASARLFAPLDEPEDLVVVLRAASRPAALTVAVVVNGFEAGRVHVTPEFSDQAVPVVKRAWRRGINTVDFRMEKAEDAYLLVDRVVFERREDGER